MRPNMVFSLRAHVFYFKIQSISFIKVDPKKVIKYKNQLWQEGLKNYLDRENGRNSNNLL